MDLHITIYCSLDRLYRGFSVNYILSGIHIYVHSYMYTHHYRATHAPAHLHTHSKGERETREMQWSMNLLRLLFRREPLPNQPFRCTQSTSLSSSSSLRSLISVHLLPSQLFFPTSTPSFGLLSLLSFASLFLLPIHSLYDYPHSLPFSAYSSPIPPTVTRSTSSASFSYSSSFYSSSMSIYSSLLLFHAYSLLHLPAPSPFYRQHHIIY